MTVTLIETLRVNRLQGDFYDLFKKYLEQHHVIWNEEREEDRLVLVYLTFPPGTKSEQLTQQSGFPTNHKVTFPDEWIMFWSFREETQATSISIPTCYLGRSDLA